MTSRIDREEIAAFERFSDEIRHRGRYVLSPPAAGFVARVVEESRRRAASLRKGWHFYRARIGFSDTSKPRGPLPARQLNAPPPELTKDARANPRGISYLYLSGDERTAICEVRPWFDARITVGRFTLRRDLRVLDLVSGASRRPPPRSLWRLLDTAFSIPVSPDEAAWQYAPTQYLTEAFKKAGFHGIRYSSSLSRGFNLVLFGASHATPTGPRKLYRVTRIHYGIRRERA